MDGGGSPSVQPGATARRRGCPSSCSVRPNAGSRGGRLVVKIAIVPDHAEAHNRTDGALRPSRGMTRSSSPETPLEVRVSITGFGEAATFPATTSLTGRSLALPRISNGPSRLERAGPSQNSCERKVRAGTTVGRRRVKQSISTYALSITTWKAWGAPVCC